MDRIFSRGSDLATEKGKIILKGVSIPDVYRLKNKEKQDVDKTLSMIKDIGFNVVRIPILPGNAVVYGESYISDIKRMVESCLRLGLYCILDWHAIGNPLANETRLQEYFHEKGNEKIFWYLANLEMALDKVRMLANIFGGYDNVIFEVFNEPCPSDKDIEKLRLSALPFSEWRNIAVKLIHEVRKESDNLIIVSSNYWSFNLKDTSLNPYTEFKNISYSFHNYPLRNNKNWKEMMESLRDYPIIVTEFGYDVDEKSHYKSSYEEYMEPFMSYLEINEISWVAWCFSASWRPRIIEQWEPFSFSDFGNNLKRFI